MLSQSLKSRIQSIVIAGFASFSMFFGSNLFVPLLIGQKTGSSWPLGFAGLLCTDIIVSFLGVLGIILTCGDKRKYFKELPFPIYFGLMGVLLLLLGPLGVLPRCIFIAFSGIERLVPAFPFAIFALLFCVIVVLLILDENNVVGIIGKFLAPIKFSTIMLVTIIALYVGPSITAVDVTKAPFKFGFEQGYQTMDLAAAFFFSAAIYKYIKNHVDCDRTAVRREIFIRSLWGCILGAALITSVFLAFFLMGAKFSLLTTDVSPYMLFPAITDIALGKFAVLILAITLCASCITTGVILAELFVEFLYEDVFKGKISRGNCIVATMVITYSVSLMGFMCIFNFLAGILAYVYPFLIVFSIYKLIVLIVRKEDER